MRPNEFRKIHNGGWARQITQDDFKISTTISGVSMRLGPGGVRELHWQQQAEWAVMTYGNCRVTILDQEGRLQVADVKEGDLWYFPAGLPHWLQGLDPDGAEFVLAFDNGESSLPRNLRRSEVALRELYLGRVRLGGLAHE